MEYLLLIHNNSKSQSSEAQWNKFFELAKTSGMFMGGSEVGFKEVLGNTNIKKSESLSGFMRFQTSNKEELKVLLENHPIVLNGGSVELCELPES